MEQNNSGISADFIISFFPPRGMIDWFEIVKIAEEPNIGNAQAVVDTLGLPMSIVVHEANVHDSVGVKVYLKR